MWKQEFILLLILFFVTPAAAQIFNVTVDDTSATGMPGEEIVLGGTIYNLQNNPLDISVIRQTNEIPADWSSSLCLEYCALPWLDSLSGTISAADSAEFSIHFFTDSQQPGSGKTRLLIQDSQKTDSISFVFHASTEPTSVTTGNIQLRRKFRIIGNYPNPFNNQTLIVFETGNQIKYVELEVFDIQGKLVLSRKFRNLKIGKNLIIVSRHDFERKSLASGIYFYRINNGNYFSKINKFTFLK